MQTYITTAALRTGAGAGTVTGIVDKDGTSFTPKSVEVIGLGTLNTLMSNSGSLFKDAFVFAGGVDDLVSERRFGASADAAGFGFKIVDFGGAAIYSIGAIHAQLSFGGYIPLKGYFHSPIAGQVSYTLDLCDDGAGGSSYPFFVANQSVLLVFRGGDDLSVDVGNAIVSGAETPTGFDTKGVVLGPTGSGSGTTGAGGGGAFQYGFATSDGSKGVASVYTINQLGVERYLSTGRAWGGTIGTGSLPAAGQITAWSATGFTANANVGGAYHAVGGPAIRTAGGSITQPLTTGNQTIATGIKVRLLRLLWVGAATSASIRTDMASACVGVSDGTRAACFWAGEIGSNPSDPKGARKLINSGNTILVHGEPNEAATTFTDVLTFVSADPETGDVVVDWTAVNGIDQYEVLWYAEGEEVGAEEEPEEPVEGTTRLIRCARRFRLAWDQNFHVIIHRIEFELQAGVGLSAGQGSDPIAMIRFSKDGGHTWGNEFHVPMGQIGQFFRRAYRNKIGQGRDWVCEIAVSDPVFVGMIACFIDAERGTH